MPSDETKPKFIPNLSKRSTDFQEWNFFYFTLCESHWVPHSYGLVPHLSKKLRKLQFLASFHSNISRGYFNAFLKHSICFQTFSVQAFKIVVNSWTFSMLFLNISWERLTNFYDFRFKSTATAAIGIHPIKAWLSQLVNFKNAIWTWGKRYAIKFSFKLGKNTTETHGILQTAFGPTILQESTISFLVA